MRIFECKQCGGMQFEEKPDDELTGKGCDCPTSKFKFGVNITKIDYGLLVPIGEEYE